MKSALKWYGIAFAIFFLFGAALGNEETSEITDEEAVLQRAVQNTRLEVRGRTFPSMSLMYSCENVDLFEYNLKSSLPIAVNGNLPPETYRPPHKIADKMKLAGGVISSAIGLDITKLSFLGIVGRVKQAGAIEGVAETAGSGFKLSEKIAIAAGASSGFFLGYLVTSKDLPSCHSSTVLNKLYQPDFWQAIQREHIRRKLFDMSFLVDGSPVTVLSVQERLVSIPSSAAKCEYADLYAVIENVGLSARDQLAEKFKQKSGTWGPDDWRHLFEVQEAARVASECQVLASIFPDAHRIETGIYLRSASMRQPRWSGQIFWRIVIWISIAFGTLIVLGVIVALLDRRFHCSEISLRLSPTELRHRTSRQ
jgi:hypothetical protein